VDAPAAVPARKGRMSASQCSDQLAVESYQ
jgi:hypothetical protein